MTNIDELFSGVCVIVDDAFGKEDRSDNIWKIRKSIEERNIPVLAYPDLPHEGQIKHYKGLNFMLLDWKINPIAEEEQLEGVRMGDASGNAVISFIKRLNEQTYIPIFIFSQENVDTIKRHLSEADLLVEGKFTNIFVKSKSDLLSTADNPNTLFDEIEKWLKATPSIYVLKEWENAARSAKRNLFWSFSEVHHAWPSALKKAFKSDGADPSHELGAFIFKNIIARTSPILFDDEIVNSASGTIGKDDLRRVLERERYLTEHLPGKPATGCLFRISCEDKTDYYLNIRPDCDIIREENPYLYLLKGAEINESKINCGNDDSIIFKNGELREKINSAYLACVDDGKTIEFSFRKMCIKRWKEVKDNRIGRVLPPYITRIQQKYAFYLQRQGVPGLPAEIFETS